MERSVAAVSIKPVGKASGLANVKIMEPVIVDVTDGNAIVPVDVDAARHVEDSSPVVGAVKQLLGMGLLLRKHLRGDVHEDGAAERLRASFRASVSQAKFAGFRSIPRESPGRCPFEVRSSAHGENRGLSPPVRSERECANGWVLHAEFCALIPTIWNSAVTRFENGLRADRVCWRNASASDKLL